MNDAYIFVLAMIVGTWKVWLSGIALGVLAVWFINRNYTE